MWYVVLQKNLYKIGLTEDIFEQNKRPIAALVHRMNSIAHGNAHAGVEQQEFTRWEVSTNSILSDITRLLYDYANHQRYLQQA